MRKRTVIGTGVVVALVGALLSYQSPASAHGTGGWGMTGGYGPGHHMGMMGGYGPGSHMGFGSGQHMGYGPDHHMGYGPGHNMGAGGAGWNCLNLSGGFAQGDLNLSADDVKARMERWLAWRGNPRLKVGDVKEKDDTTITADIVTKDNSLVERFVINRKSGWTRRDDS